MNCVFVYAKILQISKDFSILTWKYFNLYSLEKKTNFVSQNKNQTQKQGHSFKFCKWAL